MTVLPEVDEQMGNKYCKRGGEILSFRGKYF